MNWIRIVFSYKTIIAQFCKFQHDRIKNYMWFWYAFFSALFSGFSVLLNKKALFKINTSLVSWSLFAFSIPFLIFPAFKDGIPELTIFFWPVTILAVVIFALAKTLALKSLKGSLMSEIIPLSFFGVFFQYIFGLIFFSEVLKFIPFIGLVLIIFGGYLLKIKEAKEGILQPFKLLFTNKNAFIYLIALILMVLTSSFDKMGLNNMKPVNQSFLLLWENFLTTILIGLYMTRKKHDWIKDLKDNFLILSVSGITYTFLSLFYLYGITDGSLALVSGVKKLEIFFALILGWFMFGDKPEKEVWFGSLIMLLGVALIKIG